MRSRLAAVRERATRIVIARLPLRDAAEPARTLVRRLHLQRVVEPRDALRVDAVFRRGQCARFGGFDLGLGSRVVHSVSRLNTTGITGSDGVSIEECTVDRNTNDGIRVTSRGLVSGNVASANAFDGIEASGNENRIEDNESNTNGVGIRVSGVNNLIIKNSVSSNTTAEYSVPGGNKIAPISADPATAVPWANFDL